MTRVIDLLDYGLSREPDRVCVQDDEHRLTHREVQQLTHRVAHAIRAAGLGRGSRVGFVTQNCALAMVAMVAVFRAGAVWLPVHPRNTVEASGEFLADNGCELLFHHSTNASDAERLAGLVPSLRLAVCLDGSPQQPGGLLGWAADRPGRFDDDGLGPDDLAWVKGTGGTTGRPKSVLVSQRSAALLFATFNWCVPIETGHVMLVAAPISHGAGTYALCALCNGGTLVVIPRADPAAVHEAIVRHDVTSVFLPPTVIYGMLALPQVRQRRCTSLRHLIYSAAPMSAARLSEALDVFGPVLTQLYGQTEALAMLTVLTPADHWKDGPDGRTPRLLSCGRPTPFVRLAVMSDDGRLLGDGEVGEIVVRSEMTMRGYRDDPAETARVSEFGWHHTGDIGMRDDEGFYYIVDRKKDMLISGGFNIFPSEIEQVLWRHPAVLDCAVVGAPDDRWGEVITAVIELRPGQAVDESELKAFVREALGGLKTPKRVEFWPTLPRSAVGKVLRREVRDRFWAGQARRI